MDNTVTENQKNIGAFIHLSTFLKYIFPFANFIAPLILWTANKEKAFVDEHGKQAVNFQLSILVYTLAIGIICLPFFVIFAADFVSLVDTIEHTVGHVTTIDIQNISGYALLFCLVVILLFGLFVFELYSVITATVHAARGELYKYPLCIQFIKTTIKNQSKNEHIS